MEIVPAKPENREDWNEFVIKNFPVVGAFFQSWEWGEFKQKLGHEVKRFIAKSGKEWLAIFSLEKHTLPLGVDYYYLPRGPVIKPEVWHDHGTLKQIFGLFGKYIKAEFPKLVFMRLEPPIAEQPLIFFKKPFNLPRYYIQPRANRVIDISLGEAELLKTFSRDMRHDLHAAEKRNIRVQMKSGFTENEYAEFQKMQADTSARAHKGLYPGEDYYRNLFAILPPVAEYSDKTKPSCGFFFSYSESLPVAANIVIFFGSTATYLFGASLTHKLAARAPSHLHWQSMRAAKERGFNWYDIGGVDDARWPTLTYFKNQFGGALVNYVGNVDLVLRPNLYTLYNIIRRFKHPDV